jgi:spermidine synthase
MPSDPRTLLFLFALSGFSGLVYESIWSHYLKLFLGHAAYAQTVVLAIFMGGMALGAALCARRSGRWGNLLRWYAATEGAIGAIALFFHEGFARAVEFSYLSVFPHLPSPAAVSAFKWALSAAMILPQAVLLGMTFPLMSGGILRAWPERPGRSVALLYFSNSIGAAAGGLACGFWMVRHLGLPGTIRAAGLLNVALAAAVFLLSRGIPQPLPSLSEADTAASPPPSGKAEGRWYAAFLAASLLTGAASFLYEVGWIRMLSLVLGASTHAFELMLSAFILGLALGGLWIHRRIDRLAAPVRFLGWVQIAMGLLALSTLATYGYTFGAMQGALAALEKSSGGYALFNLASHGIALAVMLPATFCAGTTLPLITFSLLKRGHGERSIGAVYAANTVGAIAGVFLGIHAGFPLAGLKGVVGAGAVVDAALGLGLLWAAREGRGKLAPALATAGVASALAAAMLIVRLDPYKMASGVYRNGTLLTPGDSRVLFHKDGKTATVSVTGRGKFLAIRTNGKVDAGVNLDPEGESGADESTMVLSGVLPLAFHPQARTAANIGMGCGMTTHSILLHPGIAELDTIEIEREMVEAARLFGDRVERGFTDPRSRIHIDDAKSFFSATRRKYDIIVSEPSNPWVSGVGGLFSVEFYRQVRRHLNEDGLFVQWLQMYEIDLELVVSVLKAVSDSFPDFVAYAPNSGDLLLVAKKRGALPPIDPGVLRIPAIAEALEKVSIRSVQDLEFRKVGDRKTFLPLIASVPVRANSDYYPVLDQNAARARFLKSRATEFVMYGHMPLPAYEILSGTRRPAGRTEVTPTIAFGPTLMAYTAMGMRDYILKGEFDAKYRTIPAEMRDNTVMLCRRFFERDAVKDPVDRIVALYNTGSFLAAFLSPDEIDAVWMRLESGPGAATLSAVEKGWIALFQAIGRRDARGMDVAAKALLAAQPDMQPIQFKYAVVAGTLGASVSGNRKDMEEVWSRHRREFLDKRESRFLYRLLP